jgi:hypothetical protein
MIMKILKTGKRHGVWRVVVKLDWKVHLLGWAATDLNQNTEPAIRALLESRLGYNYKWPTTIEDFRDSDFDWGAGWVQKDSKDRYCINLYVKDQSNVTYLSLISKF